MNLWTAPAVTIGERQFCETIDGQTLIYHSMAAAVLRLSIITDKAVDDCLSMKLFIFHEKYYCNVTMGVAADQRTFVYPFGC